jgi:hypothetical protein
MIQYCYLEIRTADQHHNHQIVKKYQKIILIDPIKFRHKNYDIFKYVASERHLSILARRVRPVLAQRISGPNSVPVAYRPVAKQ